MCGRRTEAFHEQRELALSARGRFERTFFGLGLFAATNVFPCGAYLLGGALLDPLRATDVAMVVAGFVLALASFVVAYLIWSRGREALARRREMRREAAYPKGPVLTIYGQTVEDPRESRRGLAETKGLPAAR